MDAREREVQTCTGRRGNREQLPNSRTTFSQPSLTWLNEDGIEAVERWNVKGEVVSPVVRTPAVCGVWKIGYVLGKEEKKASHGVGALSAHQILNIENISAKEFSKASQSTEEKQMKMGGIPYTTNKRCPDIPSHRKPHTGSR